MNAICAWWVKWIWCWLGPALRWTVGHPTFYDVLAAGGGQIAASLGWFRPWVTAVCFAWLLYRAVSLRRRLMPFLRK